MRFNVGKGGGGELLGDEVKSALAGDKTGISADNHEVNDGGRRKTLLRNP